MISVTSQGKSQSDALLEKYSDITSLKELDGVKDRAFPVVVKSPSIEDILDAIKKDDVGLMTPVLKASTVIPGNDINADVKKLHVNHSAELKSNGTDPLAGGIDYSRLSGHTMVLALIIDKLLELITALMITDNKMKTDNTLRQSKAVEVSAEHTIKAGEKSFTGALAGAIVGGSIAAAGTGMSVQGTVKHARANASATDKKIGLQASASEIRESATRQPFKRTAESANFNGSENAAKRQDIENLKSGQGQVNTDINLLQADMKRMGYQYQTTMMRANLVQQMSQPMMAIANAAAEMEAAKSRAASTRADQDSRVFDRASSNDADDESKAQKVRGIAFELEDQLLKSIQQTASHIISRQA